MSGENNDLYVHFYPTTKHTSIWKQHVKVNFACNVPFNILKLKIIQKNKKFSKALYQMSIVIIMKHLKSDLSSTKDVDSRTMSCP